MESNENKKAAISVNEDAVKSEKNISGTVSPSTANGPVISGDSQKVNDNSPGY